MRVVNIITFTCAGDCSPLEAAGSLGDDIDEVSDAGAAEPEREALRAMTMRAAVCEVCRHNACCSLRGV